MWKVERSFRIFFIRSIMPSWCESMTTSNVFISFLLLIKAISSCVISPSESVAIVGNLSSFSCNARSNNEKEGSIEFIKLGSDRASGTDIFRPPAYNRGGDITKRLYLADGYFLSHLDDDHSYVTIQINDTQLKHGGQYFCSCVDSTSTLGTANFAVLGNLSFVKNGDKDLPHGAQVDLTCSVLFYGSTLYAFIDLTISDANGTQVSSKGNLSLISNVTGHHVIHRKVVADEKEQRFTCELRVWNNSSTEGRPLLLTIISLKCDHQTTSTYDSMSSASQATGSKVSIALGVIVVVVAVCIAIYIYYTRHRKQSTTDRNENAQSGGQRSPATNQDIQNKDEINLNSIS